MQNVLLVIQLLLAVALVAVILVQRTAQDGGGLTGGGGGGTMGGLFTARGSANLLTRATSFLAAMFIINSLALGALASREHKAVSLLGQIPVSATKMQEAPVKAPAAKAEAPAKPAAPQVPMAK
ncbi:MAG: preprotein translocase subunit SecG [Alphaproteobacteria bacterium]|nr:preprotein translocase subunit SecG [Alphaproteobacteria bacterium]